MRLNPRIWQGSNFIERRNRMEEQSIWKRRVQDRQQEPGAGRDVVKNIGRIMRATQGQAGLRYAPLENNALLFAPRIVFRFC